MRISIEDYESRALDYVEGNLPADELPAFEAFLSEHPDLGREIRSMPIHFQRLADVGYGDWL